LYRQADLQQLWDRCSAAASPMEQPSSWS